MLMNEGNILKTEDKDSDLVSIVDNICSITRRQINLFFMKLWKKYSSVQLCILNNLSI